MPRLARTTGDLHWAFRHSQYTPRSRAQAPDFVAGKKAQEDYSVSVQIQVENR
jgi:hypothetical protein